jgi:hypothetical protein
VADDKLKCRRCRRKPPASKFRTDASGDGYKRECRDCSPPRWWALMIRHTQNLTTRRCTGASEHPDTKRSRIVPSARLL